ncbi:hypothetical protein ASB57_16635 [Bordetella sp. N]|nr:hypothetical protein ASB57_16635 [Bordetella sp. N]
MLLLAAAALSTSAWAADYQPTVLVRFSGSAAAPAGASPITPPLLSADGKLYGVTQTGMPALGAYGQLPQGTAYTLDPATALYSAVALGDFGRNYGNLVQRSDGLIYGRTSASMFNASSYSSTLTGVPALLRIDKGVPTPIAPRGADQVPFYTTSFLPGGSAAIDANGVIYFSGGSSSLWRMNADESVQQLVNFRLPAYLKVVPNGTRSTTYYTKGDGSVIASVWSTTDQALYGITSTTSGVAGDPDLVPSGDKPAGTLFRIRAADIKTDGASTVEVLHTFASVRDGQPFTGDTNQTGLLEDGDWLYGTSFYHGLGTTGQMIDGGSVWRMRKSDPSTFQTVHHFRSDAATDGTADGDGSSPFGPLVKAADGNIYGTTARDGRVMNTKTAAAAKAAIGAGALFRIKVGSAADRADDVVEVLYRFDPARDGARPVGLTAGPIKNNVQKLYGATRYGGGDGNTYDGSDTIPGYGTVYSVDVSVPAATVSSLTASASSVTTGDRVTLSWTSTNASVCRASGAWTGSKAVTGSEEVTPLAGNNVYTLQCETAQGEQSATRSVTVKATTAVSSNTGSSYNTGDLKDEGGGGGGPMSELLLAVLLALSVFHRWRA